MTESYVLDRVIFKKGQQAKFILLCKSKLNMNQINLSRFIGVSQKTLYTWILEKKKMSHSAVLLLSKEAGIPTPTDIKVIKWVDHLKRAGTIGGQMKYKKYGFVSDEKRRKSAWRSWWNSVGKDKQNSIFNRVGIRIPPRDKRLAEFVGIMIGDGNVGEYAIRVTLDALSDKNYITYVKNMVSEIFGIKVKLYKHKKFRAIDVVVQSRNVVEFCIGIGLKQGNKIKNNIDIPDWIKASEALSIACVRGLVDTDGCVFKHTYTVNKKKYSYNKIAFTNKNKLVLLSVYNILIKLGFCVRITKDGNDVRIENKNDVYRYLKIIGTSNVKFLKKIVKRKRVGVV
jgi:hypothetical protein